MVLFSFKVSLYEIVEVCSLSVVDQSAPVFTNRYVLGIVLEEESLRTRMI